MLFMTNLWRASRDAHMDTHWFFLFWLRACGTHTPDFLTLPIECRCCTMVEWSQFITFASSRVHWHGSLWINVFKRSSSNPKGLHEWVALMSKQSSLKWESTAVGQVVACMPVTQRAQVWSPVGTSFLGEVFSGFFLTCKTNIGKLRPPRSPNIIWPSLSSSIIIHYGCQWPEMLTRPKVSNIRILKMRKPFSCCALSTGVVPILGANVSGHLHCFCPCVELKEKNMSEMFQFLNLALHFLASTAPLTILKWQNFNT